MNRQVIVLACVFAVQVLCTLFFLSDVLSSLIGIRTRPLNWQLRELMEIGAAAGLILGGVLALAMLRRALRDAGRARTALRAASGAFADVLEDHFRDWHLTPAERDVALFAIKGLSTQEIATARNTSEGTVKAQTAAIYRKAGVTGRPQLLSLFIDDLMDDGLEFGAEPNLK